MNNRLIVLVSVLVVIAIALLAFAFSESAVQNYDIAALIADKKSITEDITGIFEGFLFFYNEKTNEAKISNEHPRTGKNASTIEVKISEKTRKPQLFIGARIYVHGTYQRNAQVIVAEKIEASCPSKEENKLTDD